jgi:LEA14-like dessication related protein
LADGILSLALASFRSCWFVAVHPGASSLSSQSSKLAVRISSNFAIAKLQIVSSLGRSGIGRSKATARIILLGVVLVFGPWQGTAHAAPVPGVSIERIDAIRWHSDGATVELSLRLENPQGVALPLQSLHFQCFFTDTPVAAGASLGPVRIPAGGSAIVPVRLEIDPVTVMVLAQDLSSESPLTYRIEGVAEVGLTGIAVPFSHSGTIDLGRQLQH